MNILPSFWTHSWNPWLVWFPCRAGIQTQYLELRNDSKKWCILSFGWPDAEPKKNHASTGSDACVNSIECYLMHARWAILNSIFPRLYFSLVFSCLIAIFCHTIQSGAPCLQIGKIFKFAIQLGNEISLHRGNIVASCQKPWQHNIAGTFGTNVWMDRFPLMGPEPVMAQRTRNYMLHIYRWALKSASSC